MTSPARFNPPPSWPPAPSGWTPPAGWTPPSDWPPVPEGWTLWLVEALDDTSSDSALPAREEITGDSRAETPTSATPLDGHPPRRASRRALDAPASRDEEVARLEATIRDLRAALESSRSDVDSVELDDDQVLQSVGIYRYHHPLEDAAAYRDRLREIEGRIASLVRAGNAIERSNMFTFDNSLAKGRKMSDDLSRLMLRAYNAEADISVRALRAGNVETAKRRLQRSREAIARLGSMMEMRISPAYHELREQEIELTSDWLMKKQEERERQREETARLREERKVQKELEAERERLDKERTLIEQTIAQLRADGRSDEALEQRLLAIADAIEQNDFRAANIRAGYVYVISNRGAFGDGVVKIGLTRRLEPLERVSELSGASVPFRFDVHTIYFSEDAVTLEWELHRHFATRALNQANVRKEFFFATPAEVRDVLLEKVGNLLEFREDSEASEFLQSVSAWPEERGRRAGV
jgi:hypothetical protein